METRPTPGTSEIPTETLTGSDRTSEQPLCLTITADGRENLGLRLLLREVLPVLNAPDHYSPSEREDLRHLILIALDEAATHDQGDGDG